jgi:RNase P/RNase MRP subunit p29
LKQGVQFVVKKAGEEYIIEGSLLTKRPHERIKKS